MPQLWNGIRTTRLLQLPLRVCHVATCSSFALMQTLVLAEVLWTFPPIWQLQHFQLAMMWLVHLDSIISTPPATASARFWSSINSPPLPPSSENPTTVLGYTRGRNASTSWITSSPLGMMCFGSQMQAHVLASSLAATTVLSDAPYALRRASSVSQTNGPDSPASTLLRCMRRARSETLPTTCYTASKSHLLPCHHLHYHHRRHLLHLQ